MTLTNTRRSSRSAVFVPPLEHWPAAGVYQLWLRVPVALRVTIGRLGRFTFPAGVYVYTGRASRGLPARVLRHLRLARLARTGPRAVAHPRKRWHIDYLLARRQVRIERVVLASGDPNDECALNRAVGLSGDRVAPGFGASDCNAACGTHLWRY